MERLNLERMVWMICTLGALLRALSNKEDDFIIVKDENDREYIIDSIGRTKEGLLSRICLNIRDGGTGNIRR